MSWSLSYLNSGKEQYKYYSTQKVAEYYGCKLLSLPYSIKVLLENIVRNKDEITITEDTIKTLLSWEAKKGRVKEEIMYKPARVLLQDFTGVPAVVDFASMREVAKKTGSSPSKINPSTPAHLVIDHSIQVDAYGSAHALKDNVDIDFKRNAERYSFLKWSQKAFDNLTVFPPGVGICHQVNIEHIAKVCWISEDNLIFPDTVIGTDSHTTMVNGLGVLGWGVGGIEAESVMIGQSITLLIPEVLGVRLTGKPNDGVTATDLVLAITQTLREKNVVGKFIEFYGESLNSLSLADRSTISNMAPEYGATCGIFPIDNETLKYLKLTGRSDEHVQLVEDYARAEGLFRDPVNEDQVVYSDTMEIDLSQIKPSIAGPRRPQDRILLEQADVKYRLYIAEPDNVIFTTENLVVRLPGEGDLGQLDVLFGKIPHSDILYRDAKHEIEKSISHHSHFGTSKYLMCHKNGGSIIGIGGIVSNDPKWQREIFQKISRPVILCDISPEFAEQDYEKEFIHGLMKWVSSHYHASQSFSAPIVKDDARKRDIYRDLGFKSDGIINAGGHAVEDYIVHRTPTDFSHVDNGSIVIAAITSCTNTSNPEAIITAGLVAKKAVQLDLSVKPYVKTSLAPGSRAVQSYLEASKLQKYLDTLGFNIVGFGCTTCIGNSGPLNPDIESRIKDNNLTVASVLSGNRNFEGRIHPLVRMNFLASPGLVVIYSLAGHMGINLVHDSIQSNKGSMIKLSDLWPSRNEVNRIMDTYVTKSIYISAYENAFKGDDAWRSIHPPKSELFTWSPESTYIRNPPYFEKFTLDKSGNAKLPRDIVGAKALLYLGDSVTTDHISPAGSIHPSSPAAQYLEAHGVKRADFNSYGARRGNHEVMIRGTFANIRIKNKLLNNNSKEGGFAISPKTGEVTTVYEAAMEHAEMDTPLVVIAGKEYGTGSSRDWAAKGTALLGIKAVVAISFERIHRSNLIGMGVVPFQFLDSHALKNLDINRKTTFSITGDSSFNPGARAILEVKNPDKQVVEVDVLCRIDTTIEYSYIENGGILQNALLEILQ